MTDAIAYQQPIDEYEVAFLPTDTYRMIDRWRELGSPFIELEPGVVISNLERWLYNNAPHTGACLARVREYLYIDTYGIRYTAA